MSDQEQEKEEKEEKEEVKDKEEEWNIMETNLLIWKDEKVNEYQILEILGRGSFGIVKRCQREVGNPPYREFALKVTQKTKN